jgi:hypothetical protein
MQPTKGARGAPRNPLDKYTKFEGEMPEVHVANPTSTLDFIDITLVMEWENYENGKLLAIPFGNEADNIGNHNSIGERLLTAAAEITQSENVSISTPIPSEEAIRNGKTPTSFLIYNLVDDEINTLRQRGVWSSQAITFRVTELHPPRPNFLFTIKGFKTRSDESILKLVKATWQNSATQNHIKYITESFEEEHRSEVQAKLQTFLDSVHIKRFKFMAKGNIEVPRFNVYTNGQLIPDDDVWHYIRNALANLTYASPMQGQGYTEIALSGCNICRGVDHPTGMCAFPGQDDWNGPTRETLGKSPLWNRGPNNRESRNNRQNRF